MSTIEFKTAPQILLENGLSYPHKIRFQLAQSGGWVPIKWSQYLHETAILGIFLREIGMGSGVKGAVYANTCYQWACAGMAIQGAGGALVPIYPSNTAQQVAYVLSHSDAKVCFIEQAYLKNLSQIIADLKDLQTVIVMDLDQDSMANKLAEFDLDQDCAVRFICLQEALRSNTQSEQSVISLFQKIVAEIKPEQIGQILYTSGTTGNPKGVELSHWNVVVNGDDWLQVLGEMIPEQRIDLLWLPLSHIFGWGEIGLGNALLFETYFSDPRTVLNDLAKVQPTVFMSVPAYWEKLYVQAGEACQNQDEHIANLKQITGGKLGFCLSGGAGLKREIKDFYLKAGILLVEGYGLTECSPTLTMNSKTAFDFDSVGKPFPSVEVQLAEDGEILAKGPNVFSGYYKDPLATQQAFNEEGWFMTGDLGEFTPAGFLKIVGRKKDILVTAGGKNISPQLIEQRFADNHFIEHIVLYGNERKYLTAMITLRREAIFQLFKKSLGPDSSFSDLIQTDTVRSCIDREIQKVNQELASYETIKKFWIHPQSLDVPSGFLTPSLKIRRMAIHKAFEEEFNDLYQQGEK